MSIRYPASAPRALGLWALVAIVAIAGCQSTPEPEQAPVDARTPAQSDTDSAPRQPVRPRADGLTPAEAAARAQLAVFSENLTLMLILPKRCLHYRLRIGGTLTMVTLASDTRLCGICLTWNFKSRKP